MPGRIPQANSLKQLKGVTRGDRMNPGEITAPGGAKRPRFLSGRARKLWEEYAPKLTKAGTLNELNGHALAMWCSLTAEFEKDPKAMPASRYAQIRALGAPFGLTGGSAQKLDGDTGDPTDEYFKTGPGPTLCQ